MGMAPGVDCQHFLKPLRDGAVTSAKATRVYIHTFSRTATADWNRAIPSDEHHGLMLG